MGIEAADGDEASPFADLVPRGDVIRARAVDLRLGVAHVADGVDRAPPVLGGISGEAPELDADDLVPVELLPPVNPPRLTKRP